MDKDFARDMKFMESIKDEPMQIFYHNRFIEYIEDLSGYVLDIGPRNPLTRRLEDAFNITIDSTLGDLDIILDCPGSLYDVIIFSQVIEHIFNPLLCLENIKKVMHKDSILIMGTPIKPGFITTGKDHFHEMDEYRFKKLIDRAGFEIIDFKHFHIYRPFRLRSFFGIRPFLSMLHKQHGMFQLIKKENLDKTNSNG